MIEDHKHFNSQTYDTYSKEFDIKFAEHFNERVKHYADSFATQLKGKTLLDLGSGPGNHAEYFRSKGLEVTCADISDSMVALCKEKGLRSVKLDIEEHALKEQFDGIWAYAVLLHVPKEKISAAIMNIKRMLKPGGLLGVALKEGEGKDGYEEHHKYPGTKRWFTYFTDSEIRKIFEKDFELISSDKCNVKNKYVFLHYLFRLK